MQRDFSIYLTETEVEKIKRYIVMTHDVDDENFNMDSTFEGILADCFYSALSDLFFEKIDKLIG